jgi:methyl-accepting chemotaxis protein
MVKDIDSIRSVVRQAHETAEQVRTGSDEIQKGSGAIYKTVEDLKNISKDVTESVPDVQRASRGIAEALNVAG